MYIVAPFSPCTILLEFTHLKVHVATIWKFLTVFKEFTLRISKIVLLIISFETFCLSCIFILIRVIIYNFMLISTEFTIFAIALEEKLTRCFLSMPHSNLMMLPQNVFIFGPEITQIAFYCTLFMGVMLMKVNVKGMHACVFAEITFQLPLFINICILFYLPCRFCLCSCIFCSFLAL